MSTNKKRLILPPIFASAMLCALTVLVASCSKSEQTKSQASQKVSVMLPWSISPEFAFLYTADKPTSKSASAVFAFEPSKGSSEVVQAFDLNKADFGFLSSDSLILARQKGIPIKALFVLYRRTPAVVVALKGSGIQEPKDLLGKRVGVIKASTTFPQFLAMMRNAGYPVIQDGVGKNVTLDDAINGGVLQLQTKQIDALTSFANFAPVQLVANGNAIETPIEFSKYGINIYGTVFAATESVISGNPTLVQNVVLVLLSRLTEALSNHSLAATKYNERPDAVKVAPELLSATIDKTLALIAPDGDSKSLGSMSAAEWRLTVETLVNTKQAQPIDAAGCFDDTFYIQAMRVLAANK